MHLDDNYVVLDVNSGAVHIIDKMIYDLLGFYDGTNAEATKEQFKGVYPEADVAEALDELQELQAAGLLFSPEFPVPDTFREEPVLKSCASMWPMTATCAAGTALPTPGTLAVTVP